MWPMGSGQALELEFFLCPILFICLGCCFYIGSPWLRVSNSYRLSLLCMPSSAYSSKIDNNNNTAMHVWLREATSTVLIKQMISYITTVRPLYILEAMHI